MKDHTTLQGTVVLMLVVLAVPASGTMEVDGVFGLYPPGESNSVAVEIVVEEGQSLAGLRWFHNDQLAPFPRLVLMEAEAEWPPDLSDSAVMLEEIQGTSLAWGEVYLSQPVTSTTDRIYAVFDFPVDEERVGEGTGGGPGMGYRYSPDDPGARAFISPDGDQWIRVRPDYEVAVEPIWAVGKATSAVPLASLKPDVQQGDMLATGAVGRAPVKVFPNPFNPQVEVQLYLELPSSIRVEVFDLRGRRVATPLDEMRPAGEHHLQWTGRDDRGRRVASGVYIIRATVDDRVHQRKVSLVR